MTGVCNRAAGRRDVPVMLSRALLAALALLVLAAGCGSDNGAGAMAACETLINRRLGYELKHDGPMQGATVTGSGPYVVHSAFVEPATGRRTAYVCTVQRVDDGWRLIDLQTDRST